jgi:hypothetical protein
MKMVKEIEKKQKDRQRRDKGTVDLQRQKSEMKKEIERDTDRQTEE